MFGSLSSVLTCPVFPLQRQTESERQIIVSEFQQMHHFLEEQEKLLLAQLRELERDVVRHWKDYDTKLSDEIISLNVLIDEVEEKCGQPDGVFLQVRPNCLQ